AAPAGAIPHPAELSAIGTGNGVRLPGIDATDLSGRSVAGIGDINGDGVEDLAIGAPYADPFGSSSGEVYVIFGNASSGTGHVGDPLDGAGDLDLSSLDGSNGFVVSGVGSSQLTGFAVAGVGDINGDGL